MEEYNYFCWASCPADILLMVFKKLDVQSLINCMNVNKFWRDLCEYYCEHFNLWKDMVQQGIEDEGVTFAEKSLLGWREQFLSAQQWLNIGSVNVHLCHCQKYDYPVKNICVFRDNLIIVTSVAVKYFNIKSFELIKVVERSCIKYEETSAIIFEVSTLPVPVIKDDIIVIRQFAPTKDDIIVTLTNKLYKDIDEFERVKKISSTDINSFKVHQNFCYQYNEYSALWVHTAQETGWETKFLAKYHGVHQICGIHIFKKDLYILLNSGQVIIADTSCKAFETVVSYFHKPQTYLDLKPFMLLNYCLLLKAPKALEPSTHDRCILSDGKMGGHFVMTMACYGVTCILEHAHTLLLGYEDGKIEIYIAKKLFESDFPELVLNLQTYSDETSQSESSLSITSMDVYEDLSGHHLFVSTMSNVVYELLLQ